VLISEEILVSSKLDDPSCMGDAVVFLPMSESATPESRSVPRMSEDTFAGDEAAEGEFPRRWKAILQPKTSDSSSITTGKINPANIHVPQRHVVATSSSHTIPISSSDSVNIKKHAEEISAPAAKPLRSPLVVEVNEIIVVEIPSALDRELNPTIATPISVVKLTMRHATKTSP
jgi:hypothetical protein